MEVPVPFFDILYEVRDSERKSFGAHIVNETKAAHGEWQLLARYTKDGGDGYDVEVDVCRLPASFYRIRTLPATNSVGEPLKPVALSTGSGCDELAASIAQALCIGMLGCSGVDE